MKLIGIALLAASVVGAAVGQQTNMSGWGIQSAYNALYNPQHEISFRGRIVRISHPVPEPGMTSAMRIAVRELNGRTQEVDLGPEWYLQHQKQQLRVGEQVTVAGPEATVSGVPIVMARKVTEGSHVLYLRDTSGSPLWVSVHPHIVVLSMAPGGNGAGPGQANSATGVVAEATPPPETQTTPTASTGTAATGSTQNMANNTGAPPNSVQGTLQRRVSVQNPQTGQIEDYLVVSTPNGVMNVDIGPAWYQQQQPMAWSPGGNVILTNPMQMSPVVTLPNNGNPIYLANGISYGNQYMVLRNGQFSIWNPWY